MALSNKERQKRHYERKKLERQEDHRKEEDRSAGYIIRKFSEFYSDNNNVSEFEIPLDLIGINPPGFYDESEPKSGTGELSFDRENADDAAFYTSIGRAEKSVGLLLEAARVLAGFINEFKNEEINARIAELEASDLSDPDAKKQALADIVKLTKIRDQLSKQVRWTLPEWKVKGE